MLNSCMRALDNANLPFLIVGVLHYPDFCMRCFQLPQKTQHRVPYSICHVRQKNFLF